MRRGMDRFIDYVTGRTREPPPASGPEWEPTRGRIGICCSGGGVRSASFNLGALQALDAAGILERADYLASVSGGGYIAGAVTMVAASPDQDLVWGRNPPPFAPGTPEERYLRNRSSYLAPGVAGKVRLVVRLLLGFAINIAFVGSLIVLAGRTAGLLAAGARGDLHVPLATAAPGVWWTMAIAFLLGTGLLTATAVMRLRGRGDALVGFAKILFLVGGIHYAIFVALPAAVTWLRALLNDGGGALLESLYALLRVDEDAPGTGATTLTRLFGLLAALGVPALAAGALRSIFAKKASRLALLAAGIIAPALIALGVVASANDAVSATASPGRNVAWFGGAAVIFLILYLFSDLTASSMHPFYKRRLASAFALQRVWRNPDGSVVRHQDERNPAGRMDAVERPYHELVPFWETHAPGRRRPTLVCCAAANINDEGRTPPGRNAVSFTFDRDWIGGPDIGYVPARFFAEALGDARGEDVSIPAAVAISGAAVSPSMGSMTKRTLTFLLALVNARLGVWLPNPRLVAALHRDASASAATVGSRDAPAPAVRRVPRANFTWLLREMLGMNRGDGTFLYVTDGGHWENLGLVELLRRGCTEIYCFDAAGDEESTFFTIGEAVALARAELGVEIDLRPDEMRPDPDDERYSRNDHVVGTITYTRAQPRPVRGRIMYAKATVVKDAPWDVRAYKERDPEFPTHTTLKQLFADKTFESYRALGYFTATRAVAAMSSRTRKRSSRA